MDVGSQSFIVFLVHIHKSQGISVDICIAEFQSQDAFDFIPAIPCLCGLMDDWCQRGCVIWPQPGVCSFLSGCQQ